MSVAGTVDTADQEAGLLEQLRQLVRELPGVSAAFANTDQYGQVNLLADPAAAAAEAAGDTPDAAAAPADG